MAQFGEYGNQQANTFPDFPNLFFTTFEKPKYYDYIPETFKLNWEDPHKLVPDRMLSHFNHKVFINYVHRECFNSCVSTGATLNQSERDCYNNCISKHQSSLGTFKDIMLERRRWKGWRNFISIKEFSRTPEEMATDFPTDPMTRARLLQEQDEDYKRKQTVGLREALGSEFVEKENEDLTIFDFYLKGRYTRDSRIGKENKLRQRKDIYNEFKELNEKYGAQVAELLKSRVNINDWKDIPGDDYVVEEEETVTQPESTEANEPGDDQ